MIVGTTNYHQRGENIMPQGILSFHYESSLAKAGMTALAGLPIYLDLCHAAGLGKSIRRHMGVRADGGQGWTDSQIVMSLVLLNLAGGDCVDDLRLLEADEGLCRVLHRVENHGMSRRECRAAEKRWRKERHRVVPSPSAVFRYLASFHDAAEELIRKPHKAYIPRPNSHLRGLTSVNKEFVAFVQDRSPKKAATLDMDATLAGTNKEDALWCYKSYKAYQPLNTYWHEQDLVVHSEFRDGNVPAGYQQLRVFQEALEMLPGGVDRVFLRSDTAGYQKDLLSYCAEGKHERFGVIEFAVGVDVTSAFRQAVAEVAQADWHTLFRPGKDGRREATNQQWAEVCFVPNWVGHKKGNPEYRFLAIREPLEQLELPSLESQVSLPFPTMELEGGVRHKISGIVTNREIGGEELIWWYRQRCGKSEEVHSVMKEDLAGGKFPSGDFGENAAWWGIMILALNLNAAMKNLVLDKSWASRRLKAIRFSFINLAGRVMEGSHRLKIRLAGGHPSHQPLLDARRKILCLAHGPPPY
jgi:hypothetical protein